MAVAIDKRFQFSLKPSAPRGKRYTQVLKSIGNNSVSGYAMGDTVQIFIPPVANQVFDGSSAFLKFQIKLVQKATGAVTTGQTAELDYTASSIIRSIDIYHQSGAHLESIDRFNLLQNIIYDVSLSKDELRGLSASVGSADYSADADGTNRKGFKHTFSTAAAGATETNETATYTFTVPLMCGLFGLSEKMFPVYKLNSALRLDIKLDTQDYAFVISSKTNASVTATIVNPELHLDFIELEKSVIDAMESVYSGQDLVIATTSYHTYETTIANGTTGNWNWLVPTQAMSAKSALAVFRPLSSTGVSTAYTQSVFANPLITSGSRFCLNAGGNRIPNGHLNTDKDNDVSQYFAELQKAQHSIWDLNANGSINRTAYLSAYNVDNTSSPATSAFIVGLNLDQQLKCSDILLTGYDLSKSTLHAEANFGTAIDGEPTTMDLFIYHDLLYVIDANGSVTTKF